MEGAKSWPQSCFLGTPRGFGPVETVDKKSVASMALHKGSVSCYGDCQ